MSGPGTTYELFVRWSDVDAYGHVNNVKYFEYFQEARIALLDRLWTDGDGEGSHLVVAKTDVDYKRPILFRTAPYRVDSHVRRIGRTSFTIGAEITDEGALLARAEVVMVSVGPDGVPAPLSGSWVEILEAAGT